MGLEISHKIWIVACSYACRYQLCMKGSDIVIILKQEKGKMKKFTGFVLMAILVLFSNGVAIASDGWNVSIGLNYVSGLDELVDQYELNLENEGYVVDTTQIPVGLAVTPYYQFKNGMQISAGFGPIVVIAGDRDHFELPLRLGVGYSLFSDSAVSPYIRGGVSYHVASGDYVDDTSVGFFGAVGVELIKFGNSGSSMGIEASVDTAEVDVDVIGSSGTKTGTKGIQSTEFTVGIFFTF